LWQKGGIEKRKEKKRKEKWVIFFFFLCVYGNKHSKQTNKKKICCHLQRIHGIPSAGRPILLPCLTPRCYHGTKLSTIVPIPCVIHPAKEPFYTNRTLRMEWSEPPRLRLWRDENDFKFFIYFIIFFGVFYFVCKYV
jgi:hypothetical protein